MYEVLYTKRAVKDIEGLKQSKTLYDRFIEIEDLIANNPYSPAVPEGDHSQMKGYKNLYHVRIDPKHRLLYSVTENPDGQEVIFEGIEMEGKITSLH